MTSKEGPELSYLNRRIIQSPRGINIDHTYNINATILKQWFPDANERVNSDPNPFNIYITFEIYLSETLPDTPTELHRL